MHEIAAPDRRRLLRMALAAAASAWWPAVASGSPGTESVVLWTRLAPARGGLPDDGRSPVAVWWEVAHDEGFTRIARCGETATCRRCTRPARGW